MRERGRFTPEEIAFVERLTTRPAPPPRRSPRFAEAAVFTILVSADVGMWGVVALRGLRGLLDTAR